MYLGYQWEKQVTQLTSRLTLKEQTELSVYFGNTVEVSHEEYVFGIIIPKRKATNEEITAMISDLNCIYESKDQQHNSQEYFALIAHKPEIVQGYFDQRREGRISTIICKKFNYFEQPVDDKEVDEYRNKLELETPRITL